MSKEITCDRFQDCGHRMREPQSKCSESNFITCGYYLQVYSRDLTNGNPTVTGLPVEDASVPDRKRSYSFPLADASKGKKEKSK